MDLNRGDPEGVAVFSSRARLLPRRFHVKVYKCMTMCYNFL